MFSSKKLRVLSVIFLCLFMVSTLGVCLYTMQANDLAISDVGTVVVSCLLLYSPVSMLMVGHLVATNGIEEDNKTGSVYFILYMTFLILYLASPLISVLMIDPIIDALEKSKPILSAIELPLFLLIGIIFTSQEKAANNSQ